MTAHNQHRPRIRASAVAATLASVALTAQENLPLLSGFTATYSSPFLPRYAAAREV